MSKPKEKRPLIPVSNKAEAEQFSLKVFEQRIEDRVEEIRQQHFLRPEWLDFKKNPATTLLNTLPGVIAGAAIIYPALILKAAQTAWSYIQAIVSFIVNYPQYFFPIKMVLLGTIEDYIHFFAEVNKDNWKEKIFSADFLIGLLGRTAFTMVMGYYTSGLWPSVAAQVDWLNNPFFKYIFLYPASVCIQVVGLDTFYRIMYDYLPPLSDTMVVNRWQRKLQQSYLKHHDDSLYTHMAKPVDDRPTTLREMQQGNRYYKPVLQAAIAAVLFSAGLELFAISNLGNAKETALNDNISGSERLMSIISTYSFGIFGAALFSVFSAMLTMSNRLRQHHWDKALLSLFCAAISAMSALPSQITFRETFLANSPDNQNTPHHVNLDKQTYDAFYWNTLVGSTYANWLWLSKFVMGIWMKKKAFNMLGKTFNPFKENECAIRHRVIKEEFTKLTAEQKITVMHESAEENRPLQEKLNEDGKGMLNGFQATDLIRDKQNGRRPVSELVRQIDAYAKIRQWMVTMLSLSSAAVTGALSYTGYSSFYSVLPQFFLSEVASRVSHGFFDSRHNQSGHQYMNINESDGFVQENEYQKIESETTYKDVALESLKTVFSSMLPLAAYWGSKAIFNWAAHNVFELSVEEADKQSDVWANAVTTTASCLTSMVRFTR